MVMNITRHLAILGSLVMFAAACGSGGPRLSDDGDEQVAGVVTVLESPDHGPQMCAVVAESFPPQCSGPDITNWDWSSVDAESASGTTWGEFWIQGVYDTAENALDLVGSPRAPSERERRIFLDRGPDFTTPCEPGEITGEGAAAGEPEIGRARDVAGFGGSWFDAESGTFNVVYVGDRVEATVAVRESYGGPLCLVEGRTTLRDLEEIQAQLPGGVNVYATSIDVVDNIVEVHVYAYDSALAAELADRHGRSAVRLDALLLPLV